MTVWLRVALLGGLAAVSLYGQHQFPAVSMSSKTEKSFALTKRYRYVRRDYQPPVELKLTYKEPDYCRSAEDALVSQVSAMRSLNIEWWMRTWDASSQEKLQTMRDDLQADGSMREEWMHAGGEKGTIVLVSWVLTGNYVVVSYRLPGLKDKGVSKEKVAVFHLADGLWKRTLDLENDPVVEHFRDAQQVYERAIRD